MDRIASIRGTPRAIRVDNGPEFISKAFDRWAYENGVTLDDSRLGQTTDNAFADPFTGRSSQQYLNTLGFLLSADCRSKIHALRLDVTECRISTS